MTTCFMVEDRNNTLLDGGTKRIGAMCWWKGHGRKPYDSAPRLFPHLAVMTPAGLACLDCPSDKPPYPYWTRTGEPPKVTVTPSLNIGPDVWRGFLTDGELTP